MKNHKYILIILSIITLFIVTPNITLATQGACSYHDGVDCSGSSYGGKVICNDGWVNSSVYFSDVNECKTSTESFCVYPTGSSNISICNEMQKTCDNYNSLMKTAGARTGSDYIEKPCDEAISCREEVSTYNKMLSSYDKCVELEMKRLEFYYQNRLDEQNRKSEEQFQKLKQEEKLMNENERLQEENKKLKSEEETKKIIEKALDASGRITTPQVQKSSSIFANYSEEGTKKPLFDLSNGKSDVTSLKSQETITATQVTTTKPLTNTVIPKKNIFKNIFEKFINLFK